MTKVLISQSNYIPWKGYFDNIKQADVYVVYDDVQYTKRDWRNRNYIKTPQGLKWLTIPVSVKGKYLQKINETLVSDPEWTSKHLMILKQNYVKSPYFKEYFPWIENLYNSIKTDNLTEINTFLLKEVCLFLDIHTEFKDSREFHLEDDKTERLLSICKELNASEYLSGPSAKEYMVESLFEKENIKVTYFNYDGYPEYPQLYPPFEHSVCIWDLIFNTGEKAKEYINSK